MTLREQPLLRFLAASALLHAGFLGLLQFTPLPDPLPNPTPLRVRFIEPPAGPLVDQPPPRRPEPAPPGARAIGRASSRAKAPGPGIGPIGSAESRGTPRLPTSPLPAVPEPGPPSGPAGPAPRILEARPAPEAPAPPVILSPPLATAPPSIASPSPPRLSLREQLARIGNRVLTSPVPGPYDAGRAGEGSGREATVALESRAHEYGAYLAQVKRRIEREWRYPLLAQERGLTGKLVIEFAIRQDGGLTRLHLADSSGVSILDDAALEAIRRAAPYSPLPDAMGLDRLNIVASFEYLGGRFRVPGGS